MTDDPESLYARAEKDAKLFYSAPVGDVIRDLLARCRELEEELQQQGIKLANAMKALDPEGPWEPSSAHRLLTEKERT